MRKRFLSLSEISKDFNLFPSLPATASFLSLSPPPDLAFIRSCLSLAFTFSFSACLHPPLPLRSRVRRQDPLRPGDHRSARPDLEHKGRRLDRRPERQRLGQADRGPRGVDLCLNSSHNALAAAARSTLKPPRRRLERLGIKSPEGAGRGQGRDLAQPRRRLQRVARGPQAAAIIKPSASWTTRAGSRSRGSSPASANLALRFWRGVFVVEEGVGNGGFFVRRKSIFAEWFFRV